MSRTASAHPLCFPERDGDRVSRGSKRCAATLAARPSAAAEETYELVSRQMFALTGGRHRDLPDLVQAAALEVFRSLPSYEGKSAFSTWTFRICYRTLLRHHRWHRRWLARFVLTSDGSLPEVTEPHGDASGTYERAQRIHRLRRAIAGLSPKRRAVVVLKDLEGLDLGEVARIVEAKEETVRSRLRDARKELARVLRNDPYFGDDSCRTGGKT